MKREPKIEKQNPRKDKRVVVALSRESLYFPFVPHDNVKLARVGGHLGVPAKSHE
jgi:hypothetical protein